MTILPEIETLRQAFVGADVEVAFAQLECCYSTKDTCEHGGSAAAFYEAHGCYEGWFCASHLDYYVQVFRPGLVKLEQFCTFTCAGCKRNFSVDEFCQVWPL